MVKQCFVCKKLDYLNPELSFHRFPSNVEKKRMYLSLLNMHVDAENELRQYALICSSHFRESDFEFRGPTEKKWLKKDAMPIPFEVHTDVQSSSESTTDGTPPKRRKPTQELAFANVEESEHDQKIKSVTFGSSSTLTASEVGDEPNIQPEDVEESEHDPKIKSVTFGSSSTLTASEVGDEPNIQPEDVEESEHDPKIKSVTFGSSSTLTASEVGDEPNIQPEDIEESEHDPKIKSVTFGSSSTLTASEVGDEPNIQPEDIESLVVKSFSSSSTTLTASEAELQRSCEDIRESTKPQCTKRKRGTAGNISSSDFSTPQKAKRNFRILRKKVTGQQVKIKTLQQSIRRLKARVTNLTSLLNVLKEKSLISENAESTLLSSLPASASEIFARMLKGSSRQKYTPALRSFALTLSFYSPRAYNFVRSTFNRSLPHLNTISKWFRSVDGTPGWTKEALNALKIKEKEYRVTNKAMVCNLVLDEMSIRQQVEWTGQKFTGYVDVGTGIDADTLPEAKEALVFMLVCLNGSWKLPIGYFLLNGISATEKASLVKNALEFIHESGVKVTSITFDGAPANFQMAQQLGADFSNPEALKTSFKHPTSNEEIFIFPDVCHMIKLVRNCLGAYRILRDSEGNSIEWQYLNKLVDLQYDEGLHAGTKIRRRHIQYTKEKMKVKIATQTLSKSVSDALQYLCEDTRSYPYFANAGATAKFVIIFNDLFDIFNSRNRMAKYFYKKPSSSSNKDSVFQYLSEIKEYISKLTYNERPIITSGRKTGFLGFLICIESMKNFYTTFVEEEKILKYVLTYKLSQDHLELFFGAIRSKGGFNNNPSARQFEAAYKRLIVHHEITGGDSGNAINLDATTILHCGSKGITLDDNGDDERQKTESILLDQKLKEDMDNFAFLQSSSWDLTDFSLDVVAYIAGFVIRSLKKNITCAKCSSLVESEISLSRLLVYKEYRNLTKASNVVIEVCQAAEKYFRFFCKTTGLFNKTIKNLQTSLIRNTMSTLSSTILDFFGDHIFDEEPQDNHSHKLINLILEKYFTLRIHHETKKKWDATERIRSRLTKTVLFKNQ